MTYQNATATICMRKKITKRSNTKVENNKEN